MHHSQWPSWPHFSATETAAVVAVMQGGKVNYWTGGECRHFEREFAIWCRSRKAVALTNGSVAIELALKGLGIGTGDEVLVTPRSFIASASSVNLVGATPVFADLDADSQNVTAATLARALTPRTKAIIAVHLAGWPCEMPSILEFARSHHLQVIEDCAQAHGAAINGQTVGSFGDAAAWSFCQDKIMTTGGEGGMLTTNDEALWSWAWSYKDHGKSFDAVYHREHPPGFRWLHESIGTNWRMLEMQAAIGRIQLQKMADWHAARTRNAALWVERLSCWPCLRIPLPPANMRHAWYRFYAFVKTEMLQSGWDRDRLMAEINALGVPCFSGSCPEIYRERAFQGPDAPRLPVAQRLGETSLAWLTHPTLEPEHIHAMADAVDAVLQRACRT